MSPRDFVDDLKTQLFVPNDSIAHLEVSVV